MSKKKKAKTIYVTKTFIKEADNLDEMDMIFYEEFGRNWDNDDKFEVLEKGNPMYSYCEGDPVKIDTIISALEKLKKAGATHVEMVHHCDHHGYNIEGYHCRLSTPDEVEEYVSRSRKANAIDNEISNPLDHLHI